MLQVAGNSGADIVTSQLCVFDEQAISNPAPGGLVSGLVELNPFVDIASPKTEVWGTIHSILSDFGACAKLYRKEFLLDNEIRFPEEGNYEDNEFIYKAYFAARMIAAYAAPTYFYRKYSAEQGSTQSSVRTREAISQQIERLHHILDLIDTVASGPLAALARRAVITKLAWQFMKPDESAHLIGELRGEIMSFFQRARLPEVLLAIKNTDPNVYHSLCLLIDIAATGDPEFTEKSTGRGGANQGVWP